MAEIKNAFSQILSELRVKKGVTIKQLAEKSGYTERYISYLERGTYQPSLETLYKIAAALELDPKEIIESINGRLLS